MGGRNPNHMIFHLEPFPYFVKFPYTKLHLLKKIKIQYYSQIKSGRATEKSQTRMTVIQWNILNLKRSSHKKGKFCQQNISRLNPEIIFSLTVLPPDLEFTIIMGIAILLGITRLKNIKAVLHGYGMSQRRLVLPRSDTASLIFYR